MSFATIGRRLIQGVLSLLLLFTAVFVLLRAIPGDPAQLIAGATASESQVEEVRIRLGLDQPLWIQYGRYLADTVTGDLGTSIRSNQPVAEEIGQRLIPSVQLAMAGMLLATVLGVGAGAIAAANRNGPLDLAFTSLAVGATSVPAFWLGLLLVDALSIGAGLFPSSGAGSPRHFVLPSIVIAATQVGLIARLTRSSLVEILASDYVRTAHAKGMPPRIVMRDHAIRNAIVPILTVLGLQMGLLIGGAVVTEAVFNWPGVGRLLVQSVLFRDYPVLQGLVLLFGMIFIVINLVVDLATLALDPRTRTD